MPFHGLHGPGYVELGDLLPMGAFVLGGKQGKFFTSTRPSLRRLARTLKCDLPIIKDAGEQMMRSAPFGAVLGASLLWLAVGGFALLELWPIVPHEVRGALVLLAVAPPVWLVLYLGEGEDWARLASLISNHPKRWVRVTVGALVALFFIFAACVIFWVQG